MYIEESDSLSLYLDNIKVKRGGSELVFPLNDISLILIDNFKLTITINLLNECSSRNIPVVICGDNHHPNTLILPLHGHFECTKILFSQLEWSVDNRENLWQIIIKQKIKNQLFVLKQISPENEHISTLKQYVGEVEKNDETNREGLAAKLYFRGIFGNNFSRHNDNTINACLDYGYSVMRAIISKVLVAKGLNTQLGIFHRGPKNAFNLSDDVIEIFRPIIDLFVCKNFVNEKVFTRELRLKILEILHMKIELSGQKHTLFHAVEKVVDEIIRYFQTGEIGDLINFNPVLYDL